jgi:hypothetical protein
MLLEFPVKAVVAVNQRNDEVERFVSVRLGLGVPPAKESVADTIEAKLEVFAVVIV